MGRIVGITYQKQLEAMSGDNVNDNVVGDALDPEPEADQIPDEQSEMIEESEAMPEPEPEKKRAGRRS